MRQDTLLVLVLGLVVLAARAAATTSLTSEDVSGSWRGYRVVDMKSTGLVDHLKLAAIEQTYPHVGATIRDVACTINRNHAVIARITCVDARKQRYQPKDIVDETLFAPDGSQDTSHHMYSVDVQMEPFGIVVTDRQNRVIFDTAHTGIGLIFTDQYLEVNLARSPNAPSTITGLGERGSEFHALKETAQNVMFNVDRPPLDEGMNVYGSHAVYMEQDHTGQAHGFFWLNSNAMWSNMHHDHVSIKSTGGVFDFFVLPGASPDAVWQQHHMLVGRSMMPAYWALGWHQCRWGYTSVGSLRSVEASYAKAGIPIDTIWSDIDYMDGYRDFTLGKNFPEGMMRALIREWANKDRHWVPIVDVGIKIERGYPAYDQGIKQGLFILNAQGNDTPLRGKVWPGLTYYPDFTNPGTQRYWTENLARTVKVGASGIWIDMNEPSNFCDGVCDAQGKSMPLPPRAPAGVFDPNHPPIWPSGDHLIHKTLDMGARHANNELHYNLHQQYGLMEARATNAALRSLEPTKRPFILSRSTFPSAGRHTHHWLGDNDSTWKSLRMSIPGVLNFQFFGVAMVGPDTCGFMGNTTLELCSRWMQLATFYPFARNHNGWGNQSQEPYAMGKQMVAVAKQTLMQRYSLLPFVYTQFARVARDGGGVWRPLSHQYPQDPLVRTLSYQFLVGDALMVAPVVHQGAEAVRAYFPRDTWYQYHSGRVEKVAEQAGQFKVIDMPLHDVMPFWQRASTVVVSQIPALTTAAARRNPLQLSVAMPPAKQLHRHDTHHIGQMYWDDGESAIPDTHVWIDFILDIQSSALHDGMRASLLIVPHKQGSQDIFGAAHAATVRFMGVFSALDEVHGVTLNNHVVPRSKISHDVETGVLTIDLANFAVVLDAEIRELALYLQSPAE